MECDHVDRAEATLLARLLREADNGVSTLGVSTQVPAR